MRGRSFPVLSVRVSSIARTIFIITRNTSAVSCRGSSALTALIVPDTCRTCVRMYAECTLATECTPLIYAKCLTVHNTGPKSFDIRNEFGFYPRARNIAQQDHRDIVRARVIYDLSAKDETRRTYQLCLPWQIINAYTPRDRLADKT